MLPNFIVIGAGKAGTTSLYQYLRSHPQIFMPQVKEPGFFSDQPKWEKGIDWYKGLFRRQHGADAIGEASTNYTKHPHYPDVPERISKVVPDARLVYIVRDPIERMRSHYMFRVVYEWEKDPIDTALESVPLYLDTSRYAHQIEQYLQWFPLEQLLIIKTEDLHRDRQAVTRRLYGFLGVDPNWNPPNIQKHFNTSVDKRVSRFPLLRRETLRRIPGYQRVSPYIPDSLKGTLTRPLTTTFDVKHGIVSPELRSRLEDRLREDVARLRAYIGDDFDGWGIA